MSTPTDDAPPRFMSRCGGGEYSCPGYRGLCSPCAAARRAQRESPDAVTGDEAQDLARRWAWWHGWNTVEHDQAKTQEDLDAWLASVGPVPRVVFDSDRERLFTWVLEYARRAIAEGLGADDVAPNLAIELNLGAGTTFDEHAASDLLRAAGWTS